VVEWVVRMDLESNYRTNGHAIDVKVYRLYGSQSVNAECRYCRIRPSTAPNPRVPWIPNPIAARIAGELESAVMLGCD